MIRRRLIWTLTALFIWFLSLVIIGYASRRRRVGYKPQQLKIEKKLPESTSLHLRCEIPATFDPGTTGTIVRRQWYKHLEPSQLTVFPGEIE